FGSPPGYYLFLWLRPSDSAYFGDTHPLSGRFSLDRHDNITDFSSFPQCIFHRYSYCFSLGMDMIIMRTWAEPIPNISHSPLPNTPGKRKGTEVSFSPSSCSPATLFDRTYALLDSVWHPPQLHSRINHTRIKQAIDWR